MLLVLKKSYGLQLCVVDERYANPASFVLVSLLIIVVSRGAKEERGEGERDEGQGQEQEHG